MTLYDTVTQFFNKEVQPSTEEKLKTLGLIFQSLPDKEKGKALTLVKEHIEIMDFLLAAGKNDFVQGERKRFLETRPIFPTIERTSPQHLNEIDSIPFDLVFEDNQVGISVNFRKDGQEVIACVTATRDLVGSTAVVSLEPKDDKQINKFIQRSVELKIADNQCSGRVSFGSIQSVISQLGDQVCGCAFLMK